MDSDPVWSGLLYTGRNSLLWPQSLSVSGGFNLKMIPQWKSWGELGWIQAITFIPENFKTYVLWLDSQQGSCLNTLFLLSFRIDRSWETIHFPHLRPQWRKTENLVQSSMSSALLFIFPYHIPIKWISVGLPILSMEINGLAPLNLGSWAVTLNWEGSCH